MKKTEVTFNEQKSEYMNMIEDSYTEGISHENSVLNKMLSQLVIIGLVGIVLLLFVFQTFTKKSYIEDEKIAKGIIFVLSDENQKIIEDIIDIEKPSINRQEHVYEVNKISKLVEQLYVLNYPVNDYGIESFENQQFLK